MKKYVVVILIIMGFAPSLFAFDATFRQVEEEQNLGIVNSDIQTDFEDEDYDPDDIAAYNEGFEQETKDGYELPSFESSLNSPVPESEIRPEDFDLEKQMVENANRDGSAPKVDMNINRKVANQDVASTDENK